MRVVPCKDCKKDPSTVTRSAKTTLNGKRNGQR